MVSDFHVLHAASDRLDGAHGLVTQDAAVGDLGDVADEDVRIGPTDRHGVDPDDGVSVCEEHRFGNLFPGLLIRTVVHESIHDADVCSHLGTVADITPSSDGCEDCLRMGGSWVHLRLCTRCGHVGCCDNSPNRHATARWNAHRDHPLIRSFEPGEDWWWCYPDQLFFEVEGAPPSPSHP